MRTLIRAVEICSSQIDCTSTAPLRCALQQLILSVGHTQGSMVGPLPQRPIAHVVGDEAVRLFLAACPQEWISAPFAPDYGLDVRVELVREGRVTGEEFTAQVKGRNRVRPRADGSVIVCVDHSTVNYWLGKLTPTMIVVADTSRSNLWYGWLEHAYSNYPQHLKSDGKFGACQRV